MNETSPIGELRADHDAALAKMNELAEAVSRLQNARAAGPMQAGEEVQALTGQLQRALLLHFRKEEEALFPDLLAMVSRGAPAVDILSQFFGEEADDDLKAHALLRGRLRDLCAVMKDASERGRLDEAGAARLDTLVSLTKDLLERHAKKEHELIFPMIARLLDESQMAAVRERMKEISAAQ